MIEEKIEIGFTFDPGLIDVLGSRKYTTYMEALNEIVRNSIGYRGKRIEITITSEKIIVKDNGIGMSENDLRNEYFRVGKPTRDSSTGSLFGIGKFGTQALARKTEIITQKEGSNEEFHVLINWDEAKRSKEIVSSHPDAYKPDITKRSSSKETHGTTVILTDLKYRPKDAMEFKNYAEKKLFPLLVFDKVEILVNGKKCVASKPKGECYKFDSKEDFKLGGRIVSAVLDASFGRVHGQFYLTESSDENALHIFDTFGYRIDVYSEKDWLKLSSLTSSMAFKKRITGVISTTTETMIDELMPSKRCLILKSDRSAFFEDTIGFRDMIEYLKRIIKVIHEKWLKEYKDISAKMTETVNKELPIVGKALEDILSDTGWVWKREEEGDERTVVRKHKEHKPDKTQPKSKHKILQCPQCKTINYISLVNYTVFTKNPNEEAKRKMLKNWPCKTCNYYLNPETDLYRRKSPPQKPGFITTKVKLGPGKSINIQPEALGKDGNLAEYDPDSEDLAINNEHAFFVKSFNAGRSALRLHMILSGLYAIAQMKEREEKIQFETVFNKICSYAHRWMEKGSTVELPGPETEEDR